MLLPICHTDTPLTRDARDFVATRVLVDPRHSEQRQISRFCHVPIKSFSSIVYEVWMLMKCQCGKIKDLRKLGPVVAHADHYSLDVDDLT